MALHLARDHGIKAAVHEAGSIGWGASGRHGGSVNMPASKLSVAQLVRRFGLEEATPLRSRGLQVGEDFGCRGRFRYQTAGPRLVYSRALRSLTGAVPVAKSSGKSCISCERQACRDRFPTPCTIGRVAVQHDIKSRESRSLSWSPAPIRRRPPPQRHMRHAQDRNPLNASLMRKSPLDKRWGVPPRPATRLVLRPTAGHAETS